MASGRFLFFHSLHRTGGSLALSHPVLRLVVAIQEKDPSFRLGSFSWWLLPDSNWGHKALQASALPTELKSLVQAYVLVSFCRQATKAST